MHCPRCGTAANAGQQFCRSCGMNLEKVAELVRESSGSERSGSEVARLKDLQRKHENWGGIAGLIAGGLGLLLFVVLVFSQMILRGGGLTLLGSVLILLAVAAGVMAYFQLSALALKKKLSEPLAPAEPVDVQMLQSPVSITEQTTALLVEPEDRSPHKMSK